MCLHGSNPVAIFAPADLVLVRLGELLVSSRTKSDLQVVNPVRARVDTDLVVGLRAKVDW
jgi:hypothetical protein